MGVPVIVVAGLPGEAKSALIEHWRTQALAPSALIIDRGDDFKFPREQADPSDDDPLIERIGGCACCSASMALGGALRKLRRRGDWAHLVVDLNGGAHPAAFMDALRSPVLSGAMRLRELVSVVDAVRLPQRLAGPQRRWLVEQVQSADRVVVCCPAAMPRADIDAHRASVQALGGLDSFAAEVLVWRKGDRPPVPAPVPMAAGASGLIAATLPEAEDIAIQLQAPAGMIGPAEAARAPAGPCWRWLWRASPDRVFERARLAEVLGAWEGGPQRVEAVFRTERDWYRFVGDRHEPALWRRDSRVQITIGARELAYLRGPLAALARALSACRQGS